MRRKTSLFALFLLVTIGAASQGTLAANLTVNCETKQTIRKALKLLAATNPQGPNRITVSWQLQREHLD